MTFTDGVLAMLGIAYLLALAVSAFACAHDNYGVATYCEISAFLSLFTAFKLMELTRNE